MAPKKGKPHILYGAQGADGQPQPLSVLLTRMIDYGYDPLKALSVPRLACEGRSRSRQPPGARRGRSSGSGLFVFVLKHCTEELALPRFSGKDAAEGRNAHR